MGLNSIMIMKGGQLSVTAYPQQSKTFCAEFPSPFPVSRPAFVNYTRMLHLPIRSFLMCSPAQAYPNSNSLLSTYLHRAVQSIEMGFGVLQAYCHFIAGCATSGAVFRLRRWPKTDQHLMCYQWTHDIRSRILFVTLANPRSKLASLVFDSTK